MNYRTPSDTMTTNTPTTTAHLGDAELAALAQQLDSLGAAEGQSLPDSLYQRLVAAGPVNGVASKTSLPTLVLHGADRSQQIRTAEVVVRRRTTGSAWFAAAACVGFAGVAWVVSISTSSVNVSREVSAANPDSTSNPLASGVAVASAIDTSLNVDMFDAAVADADNLALSLESDIEAISSILGNELTTDTGGLRGM